MLQALAVELVTLHMVDGRPVQLNPAQVTQLVHPHEKGNRQLTEKVKCVVRLTDGSFVSIAETCEDAEKALGGKK